MADDPRELSSKEVEELHKNADTDGSTKSLHHTLGSGSNQAASGDHTHDGGSTKRLLDGVTITGSRGGNAALESAISALVELGATDSTTA